MARRIQDIYDSMVEEGIRLATDAGMPTLVTMFSSTSRVAVWKIFFYAAAFMWNALDALHDLFRAETDDKISRLKPHSAKWFVEIAKAFQYGYDLATDEAYYDNTLLTEDQVNASKIVTYAAAVEQERGIRIKVAKGTTTLSALTAPELSAFGAYMERVKPAGIKLLITSNQPDDLRAKLRVFYNPLVLMPSGGRIDGVSAEPVQDALRDYLKNLPFNGLFVSQYAVDALQKVEGVVIVMADSFSARYGALEFANIDVEYNPDAGYLQLENIEITFIPHAVV